MLFEISLELHWIPKGNCINNFDHRFPKIDCDDRWQLIDSNSMRCTSSSWSCRGHFTNCWLPSCHILFRSKVLAWRDAYSCHNTVPPRSLKRLLENDLWFSSYCFCSPTWCRSCNIITLFSFNMNLKMTSSQAKVRLHCQIFWSF